jgi:3-oxoacyl-[acyl-carrier protein] reductase
MTTSSMGDMFAAPEDPNAFDVWAPENVSPLVAFLASPDAARVSGQVFIVWGNQVSLLAGPTVEQRFETEGAWTPEGLVSALAGVYEKREPTAGFKMPQG